MVGTFLRSSHYYFLTFIKNNDLLVPDHEMYKKIIDYPLTISFKFIRLNSLKLSKNYIVCDKVGWE